jgi:hypothetical protein
MIFFTCICLKLYKYKYKIRLELENGTERTEKNTGNRRSFGLDPSVLEFWDGRTDVLVLVLALALRALLPGRQVL